MLYKHEDFSSYSQHPHKKSGIAVYVYNPSMGGGGCVQDDIGRAKTGRSQKMLTKIVRSNFTKKPFLKKTERQSTRERCPMLTSILYTQKRAADTAQQKVHAYNSHGPGLNPQHQKRRKRQREGRRK